MKTTGIVRRIDPLGRIIVPKEIRKTKGIKDHDPIEMFLGDDDEIILKKYQPGCVFCGEMVDKPIEIQGREVRICPDCAGLVGNSLKG